MKSNIADKIKLFENAKIQHTAPLEFNPADSSQTKEEIIKLAPPPISKPRRKKKLTQTNPNMLIFFLWVHQIQSVFI